MGAVPAPPTGPRGLTEVAPGHRQHAAFVTAPVVQSLLWAKSQGFLTPTQVGRFERWADQIARKADEPIEEEPSDVADVPPPPAGATPGAKAAAPVAKKKRRIHDSAAHFSVEAPKCPGCGSELDSVAVVDGADKRCRERLDIDEHRFRRLRMLPVEVIERPEVSPWTNS